MLLHRVVSPTAGAVAFSRWPVERCFEGQKTELGMDHFEARNYRAMMRHLAITAVTFLFLSRVRQAYRHRRGGKPGGPGAAELTVCQVRTAADALIRARWMDGERRREYLRRQGEIIAYAQARNRAAADSHRKAALDGRGIDINTLRCCQME